ncbi:hypothetical protein H5410_012021 [Solanum commersonii]|uniref:Uncharacterized protein n=1 Tax=Solanum commersonii TaxID=4109 RepID=A0A9J6AR96_SOLCO|nr:hypothetical protein H5410_012021 [Solanum commersonii]
MAYLAIVFKVCFQNVFDASRVRSTNPILERANKSVSLVLASKISHVMVHPVEVDKQIENVTIIEGLLRGSRLHLLDQVDREEVQFQWSEACEESFRGEKEIDSDRGFGYGSCFGLCLNRENGKVIAYASGQLKSLHMCLLRKEFNLETKERGYLWVTARIEEGRRELAKMYLRLACTGVDSQSAEGGIEITSGRVIINMDSRRLWRKLIARIFHSSRVPRRCMRDSCLLVEWHEESIASLLLSVKLPTSES